MFTLYHLVKTWKKCRKPSGEQKSREVCFSESDDVLVFQVAIQIEALEQTLYVHYLWIVHIKIHHLVFSTKRIWIHVVFSFSEYILKLVL